MLVHGSVPISSIQFTQKGGNLGQVAEIFQRNLCTWMKHCANLQITGQMNDAPKNMCIEKQINISKFHISPPQILNLWSIYQHVGRLGGKCRYSEYTIQ